MALSSDARSMTAARCLAETLEGYGVTHLFLVPAIATQTLAEVDQRTSIERVVTHGEKAAAYMADGYARATGRPGYAWPRRWVAPTSPPACGTRGWPHRR